MQRFELDAEGNLIIDADELPMAARAKEGGAFVWLVEEPDLYTDADLLARC